MRTSSAVQAVLFMSLSAACFGLDGSRNRITVRKYRTNYRIDSWDDNREDPYRVTFWKFGLRSEYTFDTSGNIKTLTARDTEYTFDEEVGSDVRSRMLQSRASSGDDALVDPDVEPVDEISCSDCYVTWDTVCAGGLDDVCYLDTNPLDEFDDDAMDSTRRFCSGFGAACEYTAAEACGGQCTEDDPADPTPAPVHPTPTPVEATPMPVTMHTVPTAEPVSSPTSMPNGHGY